MYKVGLFLSNKNISTVNLNQPELGNPGIGGTEYLLLSLAWFLNLNSQWKVSLFATYTENLPQELDLILVSDFQDATISASNLKLDIFIIPYFHENLLEIIKNSNLKVLLWYHLPIKKKSLMDAISGSKEIVRLIVVSSEVANYFRDHRLFNKTTVINNFLVKPNVKDIINSYSSKNYCCFVGRMDDSNGLDILALSWEKVLLKNPQICLIVIGGTNLYNEHYKLGHYGFGSIEYEEKIVQLFLNSGCILGKNLFFTGKLGLERYVIMRNALIGITNPSGKESFSLTALEFSTLGVPVIAGRDWGFFDTIVNKETGYLIRNHIQLSNRINFLLDNQTLRDNFKHNGLAYSEKFIPLKIVNDWIIELNYIFLDSRHRIFPLKKNFLHRKNWLKELFRILNFQTVIKFPLVLDKSYFNLTKEFVKININR